MKWSRVAIVGICWLLFGITVLWYGSVWIHGGEFRRYLILNAILVGALSFTLLALRFFDWRIALWLTGEMNRWLVLWAGLGLLLPVPLFLIDKFAQFYMGEQFLFTLWPSYVMLMVPGTSWNDFPIFMSLSMVVNATIYAGWSALVWWLVSLLHRVRRDTTTTRLFPG
jgi:hypothetical protein